MMLEEALYSYLSGHAGLTALVAARIYPVALPQSTTLPAVTFLRVDAPTLQTFCGTAKTRARVQVSAWGTTHIQALTVAEQVRAALDNYAGLMGGGVYCDVTLLSDHSFNDSEPGWYQLVSDFEVWY